MRTFTTTRSGAEASLADAVFRGLAPDGGLYVPAELPVLEGPWGAGADGFVESARAVAPAFFPEIERTRLDALVRAALGFAAPLVQVEPGRLVLELFHGPTLAFKDVGARFTAGLMAVLEQDESPGRPETRTVLVATSGDTGGAVAAAFHRMRGYRVVVLFPRHGTSERQRRQMTTLGDNVHALSVRGTFDDCQRIAKEAFADVGIATAHRLTSANSINVARLLPQAFYYVHVARCLGPVRFVVPSGNLGNLCAGLIAARAGMPAAGFTAAVNENRGFADFLAGTDFVPRPSVPTSSNAMDVGSPSNLERIHWLYGGDDAALREEVRGVSVRGAAVSSCIAAVYERSGYVMDPHTAVAYEAASRHDAGPDVPTVVLATAHPAKFPNTVEAAIGAELPLPDTLADRFEAEERTTPIEPTLIGLRGFLETLTS